MPADNRVMGLDAVRGIAAVLVMFQHSLETAGFAQGIWDPYSGVMNIGRAGVVAFFLVSGFVIPMTLDGQGGQRGFWIGRVFRIYPLYIFSFILFVLFVDGRYDWRTVIAHLFFVQEFVPGVIDQVPASWTLSLELVWYLCASGLFAVGLLHRSALLVAIATLGLVAVGCAAWFIPNLPVGRFAMLVSCLVGMLIYRQTTGQSKEWIRIGLLIAGIFIVLGVAYRLENGIARAKFSPESVLVAWVLGYCVFFLGLKSSQKWPGRAFLAWLGQISYSVYLLHAYVIMLGVWLNLPGLLLLCFVLGVTPVVSTLSYRIIEAPAIEFGRRLRRGMVRRVLA